MSRSLNCMVVDDEPLALSLLSDYIEKTPGLKLICAVSNPMAAISYAKSELIDLIFLDMQMPELSGIEFLELLQKKCMVIITTAYSEFAIDGYRFEVLDYLLKPITLANFLAAIEKAKSRSIHNVMADPNPLVQKQNYLFLKSENRFVKINHATICYFEGARDYVVVKTITETILTLQSLKSIQEMLPKEDFIRVHKSFIISVDKIDFIERDRISIANKLIPLSETYKQAFFKLIGKE